MLRTVTAALLALAAATPGARAQDAAIGAELYTQYCSTCHGADGTGDGPLAEYITVTPPDLTGLAARHDGVFPMLEVIHIIDGRTGIRAHGGPMPVYGGVFMHETLDDIGLNASVLETRGRIMELALYLEEIQAE